MTESRFLVRIWGARGSLPAPAAANCELGSDSACVEMRCGEHVLVFDAGSGAESLGRQLEKEGVKDIDLFFSHCHLDHIVGLPFFAPLYDRDVSVRIYAGHFEDAMTCRQMAEDFMAAPFFPITPKMFKAQIEYRDFRPTDTLRPKEGIEIATLRLNHPNGCVGYRVNYGGRSVCYMTDTEHTPGQRSGAIVAAIRDADVMIYDCSYTDTEFECCRGYGHSTWQEGVRLCQAGNVKRLIIFHHRPGRDDEALRRIEAEAQAIFPGAIVGRTGLELDI